MCQLSPVTFHGDTIFCIDFQNQPYTPMRPLVENMGLDWGGQAVKLKANKERWTVEMISTVAQDGIEREMLCMPVRKLPAYLASINPKEVRPELRERIELYQAECDDALWNYWINGKAERKHTALPPSSEEQPLSTPASRLPLRSLVHAWAQISGVPHTALWPQVKAHFQLSRINDLPESWLPDALAFVQEKIDQCGRELPPSEPVMRPGAILPADMDAGRKDALREINGALTAIENARETVRQVCYPSPRTMKQPKVARFSYEARLDFYAAAIDSLAAARCAIEAGYLLERQGQ